MMKQYNTEISVSQQNDQKKLYFKKGNGPLDVLTTSARIKARCKAQKISVKNLLEQTQINRNFIYDLEKGGQIPSAEKLERIADYLDCSVDYLLGRTDNPAVNR